MSKEDQIAKNQKVIALLKAWDKEPWSEEKQNDFERWYREFTLGNLGGDLVNLRDYRDGYAAAINSVYARLRVLLGEFETADCYRKKELNLINKIFDFINTDFYQLYNMVVSIPDNE